MRRFLQRLWADDCGALIATEWVFVATILVLGTLIVVGTPTILLGGTFAAQVHEAYQGFQDDTLALPKPDPAVAPWPIVGPRLYSAWNAAAEDLPAFITSNKAQLQKLALQGLGVAASTAGALGLFLGSLIIAGIIMAFGESGAGEPIGPREGRREPRVNGGVAVRRKPTEQAHVVLGSRGLSRADPRRFALGVLNVAFGGGVSSRLFQEVREKRGLVYSIYSYAAQYTETGSFSVSAGAAPRRIHEVLAIVRDELERVVAEGLTEAELERGKGHLEGSLVLGMEDTSGRMTRLGKSELTFGEILSLDEVIRRVDAVTDADVRAVAKEVLGSGPRALALIGPFDDDGFARYIS